MAAKRTCMTLDLKDDEALISAYEKYHSPEGMWPEIPQGIRAAGITDMQIYRVGTRLFMILDLDENTNLKEAFDKMGQMPRQPEWAVLMAGFQQKLPQAQHEEQWTAMQPLFLLNDHLK